MRVFIRTRRSPKCRRKVLFIVGVHQAESKLDFLVPLPTQTIKLVSYKDNYNNIV